MKSTIRIARYPLLATGILVGATLLSGCGGATTSSNSPGFAQPTAGPVIYGDYSGAESSGLSSANLATGLAVAAVASTAKPLSNIDPFILGFAPGSQYTDLSFPSAAAAGSTVVFGAFVSGGQDANRNALAINPSSLAITTPEVSGFSTPLTFVGANIGKGPLANAQYYSAPFALPFTTTGMHTLVASVADASGQSSTTTFSVPVLAGSDAAVVAEVISAGGSPVEGATASITGADANGYVGPIETAPAVSTSSVSDAQGVVVLFAPPGTPDASGHTNTITVTQGATTGSASVTLSSGKALTSLDGKSAFSITVK